MIYIFMALNIYNIDMNQKTIYLKKILIGICLIYLVLTFIMPDAKYLGNGYVFLVETGIIYKPKTAYGIDPYVIDYKFNRHHIIAMQKVPKYQNDIYNRVEYPNQSDSVFFYVIEKRTDTILGPFDSTMFMDCIKTLQIDLAF